jgi:hypothetical protein
MKPKMRLTLLACALGAASIATAQTVADTAPPNDVIRLPGSVTTPTMPVVVSPPETISGAARTELLAKRLCSFVASALNRPCQTATPWPMAPLRAVSTRPRGPRRPARPVSSRAATSPRIMPVQRPERTPAQTPAPTRAAVTQAAWRVRTTKLATRPPFPRAHPTSREPTPRPMPRVRPPARLGNADITALSAALSGTKRGTEQR